MIQWVTTGLTVVILVGVIAIGILNWKLNQIRADQIQMLNERIATLERAFTGPPSSPPTGLGGWSGSFTAGAMSLSVRPKSASACEHCGHEHASLKDAVEWHETQVAYYNMAAATGPTPTERRIAKISVDRENALIRTLKAGLPT